VRAFAVGHRCFWDAKGTGDGINLISSSGGFEPNRKLLFSPRCCNLDLLISLSYSQGLKDPKHPGDSPLVSVFVYCRTAQ
jgi:hypothetical protein